MVRRMKDMTNRTHGAVARPYGGVGMARRRRGGHGLAVLATRGVIFSQIDVIAHIAYRPPISVASLKNKNPLRRVSRVFCQKVYW